MNARKYGFDLLLLDFEGMEKPVVQQQQLAVAAAAIFSILLLPRSAAAFKMSRHFLLESVLLYRVAESRHDKNMMIINQNHPHTHWYLRQRRATTQNHKLSGISVDTKSDECQDFWSFTYRRCCSIATAIHTFL